MKYPAKPEPHLSDYQSQHVCVCSGVEYFICLCVDSFVTVAPFTLLFGCGDPAQILCLHLCVNVSEAAGVKFPFDADPPLEVASEVQY